MWFYLNSFCCEANYLIVPHEKKDSDKTVPKSRLSTPWICICRSRKFCQRGSHSDGFFSDNEGERIQIPLKEGHHRPASETPFKCFFCWRADDSPTLNAELVFQRFWTGIAKKPYIFVIFQRGGGGGSGPPVPSSGSAHDLPIDTFPKRTLLE